MRTAKSRHPDATAADLRCSLCHAACVVANVYEADYACGTSINMVNELAALGVECEQTIIAKMLKQGAEAPAWPATWKFAKELLESL